MKHFSRKEVAVKFKRYIRVTFDSQADAGIFYGVTPQFISAVCNGKNTPNDAMLDALGLERVTRFIKSKG